MCAKRFDVMDYAVAIAKHPDPEDVRRIHDGLTAYNLQFAPPNPFDPLTILVRDPQGTLKGGLLGGTFWGWLHIDYLWLDDDTRKRGIGEQVLRMAEDEATRRACHHAFLDTMSFQAREFYERFGYTVYGVLDDFPIGHKRYWMKKALTPRA